MNNVRMLHRGIRANRVFARGLSQTGILRKAKFSSPQEFVERNQRKEVEEHAYQENLLSESFEYNPKFVGENKVDPVTQRPIPLNVELLKYKPLKLPKTHGDRVASLEFKGYVEQDLLRGAEFAARAAYYLGIPMSLVIPLKTEKRLYTVIKSPFAQAKSKENFYRTTYKKKLNAYDATPEVVDLWLSFVNKYAIEGVQYLATIHTRESLDFSQRMDELTELSLPDAYKDSDDPIALKVQELLKSDTFKQYL